MVREIARGASNVEIATTLHISVETVKTHVRQILMRMGARNRAEIASLYQRVVQTDRPKG
ncbi:response regulator transcription factor [Ralstonia nicotianae]